VTPSEAAARVRETCGVDPVVEGATVTVAVAPEHWLALGRLAKEPLGGLYFNCQSAVDWKQDGLEVDSRVENLYAGLAL
jgi:hypothetical protein